jgi:septum formation protein
VLAASIWRKVGWLGVAVLVVADVEVVVCEAQTVLEVQVEVVCSRVSMSPIGTDEIRRYVASGEPLDKAGAYAIQEFGEQIVVEVTGSRSNVIGLPVERLQAELETWASEGC